jgi:fructose-bisphosphate aldolase, class I
MRLGTPHRIRRRQLVNPRIASRRATSLSRASENESEIWLATASGPLASITRTSPVIACVKSATACATSSVSDAIVVSFLNPYVSGNRHGLTVQAIGRRQGRRGARLAHFPGWRPDLVAVAIAGFAVHHGMPGWNGLRDERATMDDQQLEQIRAGKGFIAALDQSGGSTPDALTAYGIARDAYSTDEEMFDLMQAMRSRIALSPAFDGDHILGAILFEDSLHRVVGGQPFADYLWTTKRIVPFLKVDRGLAPLADGVQRMKPIPDLVALLALGVKGRVFGTKMRSFIRLADTKGIAAIVDQQFEVAGHILEAGLVPILEPEISIESPEKAAAEELLKAAILDHMSGLTPGQRIMVKLTLPEVDNFYAELVRHPAILRVLALSGGYTREAADDRLARNHGIIASFSRALTHGLRATQDDEEFNATLSHSIQDIYEASVT